jgi:DNA ligase-associated metallophosphoesterase
VVQRDACAHTGAVAMNTAPAQTTLDLELAGETVRIDADRALFWPARGTLLVADVHFGKAQVLREGGIPLPRGSTGADLARIDALLARHGARRLLVLGDLVHGRTADHAPWIEHVARWRAARPGLECAVVRGNHDRHFDPARLGFDPFEGSLHEGPFVFAHEPAADPRGYVLAGHLHPGIVLRERHAPRARLPTFWFGHAVGVLPAFGRLTGLMPVEPALGDRVFALAPGMVVPLVPGRRRGGR